MHSETFKDIHFTGSSEDIQCVQNAFQFTQWLSRLDPQFHVHGIQVQSVTRRRDGGLLFATISADVIDDEGHTVPGVVFLRGDAVAVLPVVLCDNEKYVVLVEQARFPAGQYASCEIPAGMQDDADDIRVVAVRELEEETGLSVQTEDLQYLGVFHPTGGGSDERVTLYACEICLLHEELANLEGRNHGHDHENERITLRVVPYDELITHTNDPKALIALLWYENVGS